MYSTPWFGSGARNTGVGIVWRSTLIEEIPSRDPIGNQALVCAKLVVSKCLRSLWAERRPSSDSETVHWSTRRETTTIDIVNSRTPARGLGRVTCALLALAIAAHPALAQRQAPGQLYGRVKSAAGIPIPGVEILLVDTDVRTVTDDSGTFALAKAPVGHFHFIARRMGYRPVDTMLDRKENETKELRIELEAAVEMLDTVTVNGRRTTVRMRDFWSRQANSPGAFITREDLEVRRPLHPSDMLRTIMGVKVGDDQMNGRPLISMSRNDIGAVRKILGADCRVNYYIDGSWVPPGSFHLDDIPASAIEGIEVYRGPSETPAQFRQRETACGLIVIWTRDPSSSRPGR